MEPPEPVEEPGLDQLHGRVELSPRLGDAAADEQRLIDPGLSPVACDPVGERRAVGDDARGKMRHHVETLSGEARRRRHHVLDRGAVDMRDVDPRPGRKQGAEVLDLAGRARHHLDGEAAEHRADAGRRTMPVLSPETEQRHHGLPETSERHARPSLSMSALRRPVSYSASIRAASAAATASGSPATS